MKTLKLAIPARTLALVLTGAMVAACAISPRSAPPSYIWHATSGLDEAVNCSLARLNKGVTSKEKGTPSPASNSLRVIESGQVEEIVPQPTPGIDGEPYVVRFTAETGGTKIEAYSYLDWGKPIREALSPCAPTGPRASKPKEPKEKS